MVFFGKYAKKAKRRVTYARKRRTAVGRKRSSVSVGVKKYIKRTIHSQIENKSIQVNGGNSFGSVLESPDFNAYPMCPQSGYWGISQGVAQGNRIGNKIKTRTAYLNYVLRPVAYNAITNPNPVPCEVQLMLGYVKNTPSFPPAGVDITQLFQSGSSVTAPVGSLRDIISVINTDYWVIKKRWTHKIGYSSATGTGSVAGSQYFNNNDFKLNVVKRINITKMMPATFIFNDAGISAISKNLYFMYYAVSADGSILAAQYLPANIEFWLDYHFEDA